MPTKNAAVGTKLPWISAKFDNKTNVKFFIVMISSQQL